MLEPVVRGQGADIDNVDAALAGVEHFEVLVDDFYLDGRHEDFVAPGGGSVEHLVVHRDLIQREGDLLLDLVADDLGDFIFGHWRQGAGAGEYGLAGHSKNGLAGAYLGFFEQLLERLDAKLFFRGVVKGGVGVEFALQVTGELIATLRRCEFTQTYSAGPNVQDETLLSRTRKGGHNALLQFPTVGGLVIARRLVFVTANTVRVFRPE